VFVRELIPELFEELLGDRLFHAVFEQHNLVMLPLLGILERDGDPYFSRVELDAAAARALESAARKLTQVCGSSPSDWQLSAFRTVTMRHPLTDVPGLGRLFTVGPVPWEGDGSTVNCAAVSMDREGSAEVGPCFRQAVECGDWAHYRVIMATGEGGDPTNGRYREMFGRWRAGSVLIFPFSPEAVRRGEQSSAVLESSNGLGS
jgi:penicillin amidase